MSTIDLEKVHATASYLDENRERQFVEKVHTTASYLIDRSKDVDADYDLIPDDDLYTVRVNPGGQTVTVRIPPQSEQTFQPGHRTKIIKNGTGTLVILPGQGVLLDGEPTGKVIVDEDEVIRDDEDDWITEGSLEPVPDECRRCVRLIPVRLQ